MEEHGLLIQSLCTANRHRSWNGAATYWRLKMVLPSRSNHQSDPWRLPIPTCPRLHLWKVSVKSWLASYQDVQ